MTRIDSFHLRTRLETASGTVTVFRLQGLEDLGLGRVSTLPHTLKVLLESLVRNEDGRAIDAEAIRKLAAWDPEAPGDAEIPFLPARVLLQDFTGVPAIVDLAALRSAVARMGGDPAAVRPLIPVDLVVDHSVQVDWFARPDALLLNTALEFERNRERYAFLRWGQDAFPGLRIFPPGAGICHQVNLEHLGEVVRMVEEDGERLAFCDSVVGTDSHTTMINGLGVLGWGVGGIEAEAAMLGEPQTMVPPPVLGVRVVGIPREGVNATDLVLELTERLRKVGVVGRFVEFFGPGLDELTVPDRATLANMCPEYGATVAYFPVDAQTLAYLRLTGRDPARVDLVEQYTKLQGLYRDASSPVPRFSHVVEFDLSRVVPCLSGPKRPQDRVPLDQLRPAWAEALASADPRKGFAVPAEDRSRTVELDLPGRPRIGHGAVAIAAITSCTNTSNPSVMLAAGLVARKARARGLAPAPWVKTSLGPGSRVVTDYLERTGLLADLEAVGFHVVGYGCTTCIGNSGPLPPATAAAAKQGLVLSAVLSGNRNFEGRINPLVKAAWLASPPLVVAAALRGTTDWDPSTEPVGMGSDGAPVFLRDLWPTSAEVQAALAEAVTPEAFQRAYAEIERSNADWNALPVPRGTLYDWDPDSTYIQEPPILLDLPTTPAPIQPITGARVLAWVGDSITTDHISPAGSIPAESPAGRWLQARGVTPKEFNSYGSRRGNDRVMTRGTLANVRLRNRLAPGTEGGYTTFPPGGPVTTIFEASEGWRARGVPLVVLAGKDYGMGSSRDWAAKGVNLLGVRVVVAESFERIHRSNLVGMGVLPLQLDPGTTVDGLGLDGTETFHVPVDDHVRPGARVEVEARKADGAVVRFPATCRLDTPVDVEVYRHGGILPYVARRMARG